MDHNNATKEDLRQFGLTLLDQIGQLIKENNPNIQKETKNEPEWLRSRAVREILDISPGTLHSLRVRGKISYKKVMGSYYYHKGDLMALFGK